MSPEGADAAVREGFDRVFFGPAATAVDASDRHTRANTKGTGRRIKEARRTIIVRRLQIRARTTYRKLHRRASIPQTLHFCGRSGICTTRHIFS
jgi:hypothetical protein